MASHELRNQIRSLRRNCATPEGSFIPQRLLYRLLTRAIISVALRQAGISALQIDDLAIKIYKGGQKVFAILVLLKGEESKIANFITHDQFAQSQLDFKLPFSLELLNTIIPDIADEFFETQWEFVAPVFSRGVIHRELHDRTKLPFLQNTEIGSGGFGDVYEIQLDPDHQTMAFAPKEDILRAVRKEFKSNTSDEDGYKRELLNLVLLNELKHPNIVELLTSYTHRRKHNLIFRLATHGDLGTMLQNERPNALESDDVLFTTLAQLASAVSTVHSFMSQALDLEYIGCHHDLKPKNILFDGKTFILADFGLSRFTDAKESSKAQFETGEGHYLAPECEDYDNELEKCEISRPSDVWSFGCILAEVLTFMIGGCSAITEFKKMRAIKIGSYRTYTFHGGRFKPNPVVDPWLSKLETEGDRGHRKAVQLIRSMLALKPNDRPKAQEVAFRLAYVAVISHIDTVETSLSNLLETTDSIEAYLEQKRFKIWARIYESAVAKDTAWEPPADVFSRFDSALRCLAKCKEEIASIGERCVAALSPLYSELRSLIDCLHDFLPQELKQVAQSQLEFDLTESEDVEHLEEMRNRCSQVSAGERICMLLAIKRMSILAFQMEKGKRSDLYINKPSSSILTNAATDSLGEHTLATFQKTYNQPEQRIIVEWIRYSTHWEGAVSEEMMTRVEAIASLLNATDKPIERVLRCLGYFHEPSRYAFGFIYQFPSSSALDRPRSPRTLADVIQVTMDTRSRPSLEARLLLAYRLVFSVIDCHKVGWVHKSICSYNVVFFHPDSSNPSSWIETPYIMGFNRSRPDDPKVFTEGAKTGSRYVQYQHPLYAGGQRFITDFDYYSLGVVLLEIGLWKPLHSMTHGWKHASLEDFRRDLLTKRVPLLAHAIGNGYREAVEICLQSFPTVSHTGEPRPSEPISVPTFSTGHEILTRLSKCPCEMIRMSHDSRPRLIGSSEESLPQGDRPAVIF